MRALTQEEYSILGQPLQTYEDDAPDRASVEDVCETLVRRGCLSKRIMRDGVLYGRTELGSLALRVSRPEAPR